MEMDVQPSSGWSYWTSFNVDSPLEVIGDGVTTALLTSFTIDLHFFDHWVLPKLTNAGIRNIVLFCDSVQLAEEIQFGTSRRAGQHYHVVPVESVGVFHPKVIYLSGKDNQRACVSSANMTPGGQLRNFETAGVITSDEPNHLRALSQVRDFFRSLATQNPSCATNAIMDAIQFGEDPPELVDDQSASTTFVHNLDQPIRSQLPSRAHRATAPFVSTNVINSFASQEKLTVFVDARRDDAIRSARSSLAGLEIVRFLDDDGAPSGRPVHGKAIWSTRDRWCVVGSPNLTAPALDSVSSSGNTEAALLFHDCSDFELPEFEIVTTPDDSETGTARSTSTNTAKHSVFSATMDSALHVEGLDVGSIVEASGPVGWIEIGTVSTDGIVEHDNHTTPTRLRSPLSDGTYTFAIVHYVSYLEARRKARTNKSAAVVESLPLDLEGVRALEDILANLYALDDLATTERERRQARSENDDVGDDATLSIDAWRPAREGDEPRVPDLYRTVFEGDSDALLALVQNALRQARKASSEGPTLEDNEEWDEEAADAAQTAEDARPPRTTAEVVKRYRSSFLKLLDRGTERVKNCKNPDLRDLTFSEILHLHEELTRATVRVEHCQLSDEEHEPADEEGMVEIQLLPPHLLIESRLDLIEAYTTNGGGTAGTCGSILFSHLAASVEARGQLEEVRQKRLDDLCYMNATALLETADIELAAIEWIPPQQCVALLEPYADRTNWCAIANYCEGEWVKDVDIELEPYPLIAGSADFSNWQDSPAWNIIGHAFIAGYEDSDPFVALVRNVDATANFVVHALRVEPGRKKVVGDTVKQAILRRADGKWLCRDFNGFNRSVADQLANSGNTFKILDELQKPGDEEATALPDWLSEFGDQLESY